MAVGSQIGKLSAPEGRPGSRLVPGVGEAAGRGKARNGGVSAGGGENEGGGKSGAEGQESGADLPKWHPSLGLQRR